MYSFDEWFDRIESGSSKWNGHGAKQSETKRTLCYTTADMDFACPPCVLEGMKRRLVHPIFGYTYPSKTLLPSLCAWAKRRHGLDLDPAWIKPVSGIITGLAFALRAVTAPGDKVLVFTPLYHPFFNIVEGGERQLVACELKNTDGYYEIDFERLERELRNGVKAILLCNPHNPVGRVWSEKELAAVADLCLRYNVYLLSDEAHADFALFGHTYTSIAGRSEIAGRSVTCLSVNKTFNIPGAGAAFLVVPNPEIKERILRLLQSFWINSPPILNMAAAEAGLTGGDEWLDELRAYLEDNSRFLRSFFRENMPKVRVAPHEGTFLMWLECSCFGLSMDELARELVDECGVALENGSVFRGDGGRHLRINIGCPQELLRRGLEAIRPFYEARCGA